jgi:hypothetical protein
VLLNLLEEYPSRKERDFEALEQKKHDPDYPTAIPLHLIVVGQSRRLEESE